MGANIKYEYHRTTQSAIASNFPSIFAPMISFRILVFMLISTLIIAACNRDKEEEPVEEKPINTREDRLCSDECVFANDGDCDDGGPSSDHDYCVLGSDCSDCGERLIITVED